MQSKCAHLTRGKGCRRGRVSPAAVGGGGDTATETASILESTTHFAGTDDVDLANKEPSRAAKVRTTTGPGGGVRFGSALDPPPPPLVPCGTDDSADDLGCYAARRAEKGLEGLEEALVAASWSFEDSACEPEAGPPPPAGWEPDRGPARRLAQPASPKSVLVSPPAMAAAAATPDERTSGAGRRGGGAPPMRPTRRGGTSASAVVGVLAGDGTAGFAPSERGADSPERVELVSAPRAGRAPAAAGAPGTEPRLRSALKKGGGGGPGPARRSGTRAGAGAGGRRRRGSVRFVWNPDCRCLFAQFHDDVIIDGIFSFLSLEGRLTSSMVCRRWRYCTSHPHAWRDVDATSYVSGLYDAQLERWTRGGAGGDGGDGDGDGDDDDGDDDDGAVVVRTSDRVISHLAGHKSDVESLTVRSVEHRLSADAAVLGVGACLSTGALRRLELSSYAALTDSVLNLMLLSYRVGSAGGPGIGGAPLKAGGGPGRSGLSVLRLEQCPSLTDRSVQSIVAHCPNLEELSLRGCCGITDKGIEVLAPKIDFIPNADRAASSPGVATSPSQRFGASTYGGRTSLHSLFQQQSQPSGTSAPSRSYGGRSPSHSGGAGVSLTSMFSPPPTSSNQALRQRRVSPSLGNRAASSLLAAAFSPDSNRQEDPHPRSSSAPRRGPLPNSIPRGRGTAARRQLRSLDLSRTRVTAEGIVDLFGSAYAANGGHRLRVRRLMMSGSGEGWTDGLLEALGGLIAPSELTDLDLGCSDAITGSGGVTDAGLRALLSGATAAAAGGGSGLARLRLAGHGSVSGYGVAELMAASPRLEDLDLGGCTGIVRGLTNGPDPAVPPPGTATLPTLSDALSETGGGGRAAASSAGLRRLCLWRCFMGGGAAEGNPEPFRLERAAGGAVIESICAGPASSTLLELDLEGCYFVDDALARRLRECCPRLRALNVRGTRSNGGGGG